MDAAGARALRERLEAAGASPLRAKLAAAEAEQREEEDGAPSGALPLLAWLRRAAAHHPGA